MQASHATSRRAPEADVCLRASCYRARHPRAADPADAARLRRGGDRLGLPGVALDDGAAAGQAKARIKEAGIPFRVPEREEIGERLGAVLEAIYAAYAEGWGDPGGDR